jgi:hypothetical protein
MYSFCVCCQMLSDVVRNVFRRPFCICSPGRPRAAPPGRPGCPSAPGPPPPRAGSPRPGRRPHRRHALAPRAFMCAYRETVRQLPPPGGRGAPPRHGPTSTPNKTRTILRQSEMICPPNGWQHRGTKMALSLGGYLADLLAEAVERALQPAEPSLHRLREILHHAHRQLKHQLAAPVPSVIGRVN